MTTKITTIVENSVAMGIGLMAEHGLGYYIEKDGFRMLFDTGQGLVFENNLKTLGIEIKGIGHTVLSHGHYDHSGGLEPLVTKNPGLKIFAHPEAFTPKYVSFDASNFAYIGLSKTKTELSALGAEIECHTEPFEIAPGIMTSGEIPMRHDFETVESYFYKDSQEGKTPDSIIDDQSLVISTEKGLVVVLGCTHRGLINTLDQIVEITGLNRFHAITGGLHLGGADKKRLEKTAEALKKFKIEKMIVGHCTGIKSAVYLYNAFPEMIEFGTVGKTLMI